MKHGIFNFLLVILISTSLGAAPDRRISDNDGDVLSISSGGGILTADSNGVSSTLSPAGTVVASTGRTLVSGINALGAAGTDEVLGGSALIHSVHLRASGNNLGVLFIGPSGVDSTTGYQLHTGVTIEIKTDNIADIFFDGGTTGDIIEFLGIAQ